jgi:hypothetical protein
MAKRKGVPKADPTHWTLKPNGSKKYKGTYFRRLEDIEKGLKEIDLAKLPPGGQFLYMYYGCEKLGRGIVGIHKQWEADIAYDKGLELDDLKAAAKAMNLPITDGELDALFVSKDKSSARHVRNEVVHNFGPSNVKNAIQHSAKLNKRMHKFLQDCTPRTLDFLKGSYSHLLP